MIISNKNLKTVLAFALVIASIGCGTKKLNLASTPQLPVTKFRVPLVLRIAPVQDSRPQVEKNGKSPALHVLLPLLPLFLYFEKRGSGITSDELFKQSPPTVMQENLAAYFGASKTFAGVTAQGAAHLELQTELLHLYGHQYQTGWVFAGSGGGVTTTDSFGHYANVVMRVRLFDLRNGKKRLIMDRVVHGTGANPPNKTVGRPLQNAVRRSLDKTWYWTLAATRELLETRSEAAYLQWFQQNCAKGKNCNFNVIRIGRFHEAVDVITLNVDTGRIMRKKRLANLRVAPPGKAGEWMLSPWDNQGFPMSSNLYNAMAKFVTQRGYMVRRLDHFSLYHFSLYHFFGVRKTL